MHKSKYSDIYASMKVTMNQENFKKAWTKVIWPNGALVSKFFMRMRIPTEVSIDPQKIN